jgi:hypothetical protein
MTEPVSTAQYFPWDGGGVFLGTAGVLPAHAHQAIQICFRFEGRIRLRASDQDPWADYDLAIVPSRFRHLFAEQTGEWGCASTCCGGASSACGSTE